MSVLDTAFWLKSVNTFSVINNILPASRVASLTRFASSTPPIWVSSISTWAPSPRKTLVVGFSDRFPLPAPVAKCFSTYLTLAPAINVKFMDTGMSLRLGAPAVDSAAGNDRDIGLGAYNELVVNNVIEPGQTQDDGNMHRFVHRPRLDGNGNARAVGGGFRY